MYLIYLSEWNGCIKARNTYNTINCHTITHTHDVTSFTYFIRVPYSAIFYVISFKCIVNILIIISIYTYINLSICTLSHFTRYLTLRALELGLHTKHHKVYNTIRQCYQTTELPHILTEINVCSLNIRCCATGVSYLNGNF